jgi:tripartite-type tricarboxylate transporter receptor subunit TctC
VVRAPPDGYTLLLGNTPHSFNMALFDNLRFNFIRDLVPVARLTQNIYAIVVHPAAPELIAYAKSNPGKLNNGSAGIGAPSHVLGELFKAMAGVNIVHVPYRGDPPAIADLIGGQLQDQGCHVKISWQPLYIKHISLVL